MRSRPRLLPAAMGALVIAAAVFAILAGKGSEDSSPRTAGSAGSGGPVEPTGGASPAGSSGFDGAALPVAVAAPTFTLRSVGGGSVSLTSLRGKPVVLAFLYSRCGAVCVLIAQQIRGALDELPSGAARAVIVSAEPATDSPSAVRAFLGRVGLRQRAVWLTGTRRQLRAVWDAYRVKPASAGTALFSSYATVVLIDAEGRERVLYGQEQLTPEALAHDIGRL